MRTLSFFLFLFLLGSCRKETFTDRPELRLQATADTLRFDTVFTTTGSVTHYFKIRNSHQEGIRIRSLRLAGGSASPFRINADGRSGPVVEGIDIRGGDSAWVYVTVRIDPTAESLPFIVRDSILFDYNGNEERVQLQAYGQNARFLRRHTITADATWDNTLPYVVLGELTVSEGAKLTIGQGSRIYLHADAPFIVKGRLVAEGEAWDSTRIVFSSDRLDAPYRDFPAGFPGLFFTETSGGNLLRQVVIRNAYQGIVAAGPDPGGGTKLELQEVIIDHAFDAGLLGLNSTIRAQNLLISNCGRGTILSGGTYQFTHCTFTGISTAFIPHRAPVLLATNRVDGTDFPLAATFRNCIFWGDRNGLVPDEVAAVRSGSTPFSLQFEGVLWRLEQTPPFSTVSGAEIRNREPEFEQPAERPYSYRLKDRSPAMDKGAATDITHDLDGLPRPVRQPDLGAYEKQ